MKVASTKINSITATCPACGLLCDDVKVENNNNKIKVLNTDCKKAVRFFEQPLTDATPQINGKPVSLQEAVSHGAKLLKTSQQPLFAGLSTDVAGFRSVYNLAQKTNASLQHMNAASMARNMKVLQSTGWQTTTLTEVKNRADVIVCIGTDIVTHNPRFFERFVWTENALFTEPHRRQIIYIGDKNLKTKNSQQPHGYSPVHIQCTNTDLPEVLAVLNALLLNKTIKAKQICGISIDQLIQLADNLKNANYAVLAWVAADLDFPHAELTIGQITQMVTTLNITSRAAGLPLGGSDGDTTANNANTWLSGLALNDEVVEHDLKVWVNSFNPEKLPPRTDKPLIIFGNTAPLPNPLPQGARGFSVATKENTEVLNLGSNKSNANNLNPKTTINTPPLTSRERAGERGDATKTPEIFIPIATPGLDCSGTLFRVDSSAILPLKKVRESDLPTLSEVLSKIEASL
jgi:formylmethanofuran dehydrogenase subunit B